MELAKLEVKQREELGGAPVRRLRQSGLIPAVVYGKGLASTALSLSPKQLHQALESERGRNTVFELNLEGKPLALALLAEVQVHPVSRNLLHADFLKIDEKQPVDIEVPLRLTGKCKGVVLGGTLQQVFRKLPIRCLPEYIPVNISHDVTEVGLEEVVHVSDLRLPEQVSIRLPEARTVAVVLAAKAKLETEEGAEAPAESPKK